MMALQIERILALNHMPNQLDHGIDLILCKSSCKSDLCKLEVSSQTEGGPRFWTNIRWFWRWCVIIFLKFVDFGGTLALRVIFRVYAVLHMHSMMIYDQILWTHIIEGKIPYLLLILLMKTCCRFEAFDSVDQLKSVNCNYRHETIRILDWCLRNVGLMPFIFRTTSGLSQTRWWGWTGVSSGE